MKKKQLIIALDVEDFKAVRRIVKTLHPHALFYKVGLRLFTQEGPPLIRWLKKQKLKIFLDLKFHDIPNTVAQAVESAVKLEVDLLTLHALGGEEMMKAAALSAKESARRLKKKRPQIFAVTVLTSHQNLSPLGISNPIPKQVLTLATLAHRARMDGVVCSPQEVEPIRKNFPSSFKIITPGIRLNSYSPDDQKRTATPKQALQAGSNYLVVGRPILQADSPREALKNILFDSNESSS